MCLISKSYLVVPKTRSKIRETAQFQIAINCFQRMSLILFIWQIHSKTDKNRGKYFRLFANMHMGIVSNFDQIGEKF